jgi:uncharacterized cupredoxin-like copper-binding protein
MRKRVALTSILAVAVAAAVAVPLVSAAISHRAAKQAATVKLKEYTFVSSQLAKPTFGKPSKLEPGSTTFTFTNTGKFPHDFTILSATAGAPKFKSGTIAPGKSETITVDLKPGAYLAVCTQFNGFHYASGMVKSFAVGQVNQKGKWVK